MNERIKELAKQAEVDTEMFGEGFSGPYMVKRVSLEKFAELIIRECAEVGYDTHDDFQVKVNIKKHFGVQ